MKADNRSIHPQWESQKHFYEAWYLKLNRGEDQSALWLRFLILHARKWRQGHVWAIYFPGEKSKPILATKKIYDLATAHTGFAVNQNELIVRLGENQLCDNQTTGSIINKNNISWNLHFESDEDFSFHYAPPGLNRFLSSRAGSPNVNLEFSGQFTVNDKSFDCLYERGSQGHYYGKKYAKYWAWAHCCVFDNDDHETVFEIIDVKVSACLPALKSAYVKYKGKNYVMHNLSDLLFSKSNYKRGEWVFRCKQDDLRFEIKITADVNRIIDVEYEDVDHSKLVCHNTKQASCKLMIYEKNQMKETLTSSGTTAFEIVDRP